MSALIYIVCVTDFFSALICLILFYGNQFETKQKSGHGEIYSWMAATNVVALVADSFSWILEGKPGCIWLLYLTNTLTIVLALILIAQYALYFFFYLQSRVEASRKMLRIVMVFCSAAVIVTLIACLTGVMFTIEDGEYVSKPFYGVYSLSALLGLIISFCFVVRYRKNLGRHDSIAACIYIAIPCASALMNLWLEDIAFTYQAVTMSLLVLYVMIQSEQNNRLIAEKEISLYYAEHDELTGLYSRRAYIDKLEALTKSDENVGVIFSDLNGLKHINDTYGHTAGDRLIINYAKILKNYFRSEDICRISGDEFIVISAHIKKEDFETRVRQLEGAIVVDGIPLACLGTGYGRGEDAVALVRNAETVMYGKKAAFHEAHPEYDRQHENH